MGCPLCRGFCYMGRPAIERYLLYGVSAIREVFAIWGVRY